MFPYSDSVCPGSLEEYRIYKNLIEEDDEGKTREEKIEESMDEEGVDYDETESILDDEE